MAHIIVPPSWRLPEGAATPESVYVNRRTFIKQMGALGMGLSALAMTGGLLGCASGEPATPEQVSADVEDVLAQYAALAHSERQNFASERSVTSPKLSTRYNNSYEFTTDKDRVWELAKDFEMKPWQVEVGGLCEQKGVFDIPDVVDMKSLEERVYRFRCVEAWSMTVPWVGVPTRKFVEWAKPTSAATHIRFTSVKRPSQMVGQRTQTWYNWPYYEGIRLDEAMNEMALLVVGMYGKELSPQNGGPIRVIIPWKYGYKSPKYITKIEFVDAQPKTFWNDLAPNEYSFLSNVEPKVPHPRWSQASERLIDTGDRIPTQLYNGYAEQVGKLYG